MRNIILLVCCVLPLVNCFKEYVDEYTRNVYDDDEEYSLKNEDPAFANGREHYIRKIRSIEEDYRNVERIDLEEYFGELPRDDEVIRNKRDLSQENNIEKLGNPLEIVILNVDNDTTSSDDDIQTTDTNDTKINDFIRFKRDVEEKSRPKRDKENNSRVTDDWPKQDYQKQDYQKQDYQKQDYQKQEETSNLRAPRVHFVTQRRSESSPSPVFENYDRYYPRNYERFPRKYDDTYRRNYYENPPYFEPERNYYNPGNNNNKQRRIIYYATLPEDARIPRERYNYRDTYRDDRYFRDPDLYRYRKPYVAPKSRYNDLRFNKTPYPGKVSADVSVREIKKNPERRIYSEVDRRYDTDEPHYHQLHEDYRI